MAKKATTKKARPAIKQVKIKKVSVPDPPDDEFATIKALPGSLVITPIERKAFKKLLGLDLGKMLKDIQKKIYK